MPGGQPLPAVLHRCLLYTSAGDALDLIGGTAVEGGHGDAAGHPGGDGVDEGGLLGEQLLEHLLRCV